MRGELARKEWEGQGLGLDALSLVYDAWDEASRDWSLACHSGCPVCCSDRLALTTLEGRALARALEQAGQADLLAQAASLPVSMEHLPPATINTIARLCLAQGADPPAEPEAPAWAACPLLKDGLCAAYAARPLGCRVMVSRRPCRADGSALADPWWLTLATALLQVVEHLDLGGGYGLLPQALAVANGRTAQGLLPCQALPGIPAPDEHQARLQEVLDRLFRQPVQGRPMGWWLSALARG